MKKLTLLFVAVACLCSKVANAQDGKGSINFVPYVGVNYSDFSGDSQEFFYGTSGKVNFMAGARFEFQITTKSAIIADLNYRRLGATTENHPIIVASGFNNSYIREDGIYNPYENLSFEDLKKLVSESGTYGIITNTTKITLDYISLGAQFKQNIVSGLSARIGVEGSLGFAKRYYHYYYCAKPDENGELPESEGDDNEDIDDVLKKFNVAVPLGLTYEFNNFNVNATYHLPLMKCAKDGDYYLRNQAFDLTIGYRLPLRKR